MTKVNIDDCKKISKRVEGRLLEWRKIRADVNYGTEETKAKLRFVVNEMENDWDKYTSKVPTEKILKELYKLPEYEYPVEQSSMFLLPNGKMVGSDIIFNQQKMMENIVGKINANEFFCILAATQCVKLTVDDSILYVTINAYITNKQEQVLKNLIKNKRYSDVVADISRYASAKIKEGEITKEEIYDILELDMPKYV